MRKRLVQFLVMVVILAATALMGCGPTMTTKAKATMILSTYNRQAELVKAEATRCRDDRGNCAEAERERIREKKEILIKLKTLVLPFGIIVSHGGVPSAEDEQAIYDLIDQLTDAIVVP